MTIVTANEGAGPLILSMPHPGTAIPDDIAAQLNQIGRAVADTDWRMRQLYAFADRFKPTILESRLSRYVIDLNRDPSGASLYPGQATTELVPTTDFDGRPIWNSPPDTAEIERRTKLYFEPYHDALRLQIARVKALHGYCILYDCHSIRSVIPRLFSGRLPEINIGANGGASCAARIRAVATKLASASPFETAVDGRFKGGWITRHYGKPEDHVHAIQMEIAQRAYLVDEAPPWSFDKEKAAKLQRWLRDVMDAIVEEARDLETAGKA